MKSILIFGLLIGSLILNAQSNKWKVFDTLNSKIPDNVIKFVSTDHAGHVWFSTGDCFLGGDLCMFDGTTFQTWKSQNTGINDRFITCVAFSKDDSEIWVGTKSSGLFQLSGGKWKQFSLENKKLSGNHVFSVWVEDTLVVVGTDAGVSVVSDTKETSFQKNNSPLPHNHVNHITKGIDGNYWISTEQGLAVTDFKSWNIFSKENSGLKDNLIYSTTFDQFGNAWIVYWGGIAKYSKDKQWIIFDENNSQLPPYSEYTIAIDDDNIKWISSNFGLIKFDDNTWEIFTPKNSNFPDFFTNKVVFYRGIVWVATQSGLAKYSKNQ